MQSKNKHQTTAERTHVARVKLLACSVCDAGGGPNHPSEAHEPRQGAWWLCIALCESCHRGSLMGWHGQKRSWAIRKMDEWDALAVTIRRLMVNAEAAGLLPKVRAL